LSQSVQAWASSGKIYSWMQYYTTLDLRNNILTPIYNQFASGVINKDKFVALMKAALEK